MSHIVQHRIVIPFWIVSRRDSRKREFGAHVSLVLHLQGGVGTHATIMMHTMYITVRMGVHPHYTTNFKKP